MKNLLLACVVTFVAFSATAGTSSAGTPQNSKYCMDNIDYAACATPATGETRARMMQVTKDATRGKVIENQSRFCQDNITINDPVCEPEVIGRRAG
jgi:hypothetical protein